MVIIHKYDMTCATEMDAHHLGTDIFFCMFCYCFIPCYLGLCLKKNYASELLWEILQFLNILNYIILKNCHGSIQQEDIIIIESMRPTLEHLNK